MDVVMSVTWAQMKKLSVHVPMARTLALETEAKCVSPFPTIVAALTILSVATGSVSAKTGSVI